MAEQPAGDGADAFISGRDQVDTEIDPGAPWRYGTTIGVTPADLEERAQVRQLAERAVATAGLFATLGSSAATSAMTRPGSR